MRRKTQLGSQPTKQQFFVINSKGSVWSQMFVWEKKSENREPESFIVVKLKDLWKQILQGPSFCSTEEWATHANSQRSLLSGSQIKWRWASFCSLLENPSQLLRVKTKILSSEWIGCFSPKALVLKLWVHEEHSKLHPQISRFWFDGFRIRRGKLYIRLDWDVRNSGPVSP